jgi:hypothetical protein
VHHGPIRQLLTLAHRAALDSRLALQVDGLGFHLDRRLGGGPHDAEITQRRAGLAIQVLDVALEVQEQGANLRDKLFLRRGRRVELRRGRSRGGNCIEATLEELDQSLRRHRGSPQRQGSAAGEVLVDARDGSLDLGLHSVLVVGNRHISPVVDGCEARGAVGASGGSCLSQE